MKNNRKKAALKLFFITSFYLTSSYSFANISCNKVIKSFTPPKYTHEVKHINVQNQKCYNSCWASTTTTVVESFNLIKEPLAHEYTYKKYLLNKVYTALHSYKENNRFVWAEKSNLPEPNTFSLTETNDLPTAINLIKQYGAVKKIDWAPGNHLNKQEMVEKIEASINQFLEKGKLSPYSKNEIDRAFYEIKSLLDKYYGHAVTGHLKINGNDLVGESTFITEFMHEGLPTVAPSRREFNTVHSDSFYEKGLSGVNIVESYSTTTRVSSRAAESILIKHFSNQNAQPVYIGFSAPLYKHNITIDKTTGQVTAHTNTQQERDLGFSHAMTLLGIKVDSKGRISHFKVLNSYGTENGEKGIYHIENSFFENYFYKMAILSAPQRKIITSSGRAL